MNNIRNTLVNLNFVSCRLAHLGSLAVVLALATGTSAHAQDEDEGTETQTSGSYFCSLTEAEEVISGDSTFDALGDYRRPPFRVEVPEGDREHLTDEGYTQDGAYYWYIKTQPTDFGTYTIHGAFDLVTKTLSTSRSIIATLESGKVATVATSFLFLCESVD